MKVDGAVTCFEKLLQIFEMLFVRFNNKVTFILPLFNFI